MHINPIKPTFNALGTKPLKLKHDELLSRFAFKLKLRRYTKEACWQYYVNRCRSNLHVVLAMSPVGMGLHSFTFWLNVSMFLWDTLGS